ncbi:hypothetical protein [Marinivivus vitaminiproducens]|uniref:hypothetical protein n=1 Tax=Marinivivus vitaminiproducens TaxID=3035935 RepID=UPI0027A3FDA9|nr:hypothetical protein P4R82_06190 [Geminicoccaceae bacterium SCSIO 64248]
MPPTIRSASDADRPSAANGLPILARYGIALALAALTLGVLADRVLGLPASMHVAEAGVSLFALCVLLTPSGRDLAFLGATAILLVLVWMTADDPGAVTLKGLDLAAFLMAFLIALGFLRDAAATSPLVGQSGRYLVDQPPGRRYAALSLGGFLVGVILSYGVVTLLGAMIMRGVADSDPSVRAIREQRMLAALVRGFSTLTLWAPTSVTMALILALLPDLTWARQLPVGLGLVFALLTLGWLLDRWMWRRPLRPVAEGAKPDPGPIVRMAGLVGGVLAAVIVLSRFVTGDLVVAAMVTAPVFALGWIAWQHLDPGSGFRSSAYVRRLRAIFTESLPAARSEVVVLGSAGMIGTCVIALVPIADVVTWLNGLGLPALVILAAMSASVVISAHLGVNPMVLVTLWGTATHSGLLAGTHSSLIGLALAAGWSLALNTAPTCASMLIISRLAGRTITEVGLRWNGLYSVMGWLTVVAYIGLLDALWF